jgi:signal transduction histidine kinase
MPILQARSLIFPLLKAPPEWRLTTPLLAAVRFEVRLAEDQLGDIPAAIRASVEALEHLFAQLLDLSQLEAGALRPMPAPLALQTLFARLGADFAPQAMAAGLVLRIVPTRMAVATDPTLLERVLRNLLF